MDKKIDWKAYRLTYTKQAKDILKMLSLEEKVSLMSGSEIRSEVRGAIRKKLKVHYNEHPYRAGGIKEKGIPAMLFADGTRGVVCGCKKATCFPVASMRGAAFDPELEEEIGRAIAEEVLDVGANFFGGVCVNLPYHPGWGRAQEVYGEDPYLLGRMGSALVCGVQENGVIACVKHFAFNSMENARFKVSIECDKRTEREIFLSHFKKCIDAGAGSVMSAYNRYQGAMCGENEYLLRQVLRNEWDFDGFTICDFVWGVKDTVASASRGLDIEMPITHFYGEKLLEVVREGEVTEQTIDESALRIIRTLLAHEHFIEEHKKEESCDYRKHQELALQCAKEGITLLKNEDQLLPIDCKKGKKIVVLGSYADRENIGDRGSSQVYAPYVVTILQGITEYHSDAEVIYYSGESASHCRRLAKEADVVLVGGSMILMDEWKDQVGAILMAYYPGMEGGKAVADVLFGKTNPGGKLPFVIPKKKEDLPEIDWDAEEFRYDYYHGYTLLNKSHVKPLYPFGYGLSYTTFTFTGMKAWRDEENLYVSVITKNTGKRECSEVVQMYVGAADSKVKRPEYVLKDFQKIRLDAGEAKEVKLVCPIREMAYFDEGRNEFVAEFSIPYEVYVGTSSLREDLWVRKV